MARPAAAAAVETTGTLHRMLDSLGPNGIRAEAVKHAITAFISIRQHGDVRGKV